MKLSLLTLNLTLASTESVAIESMTTLSVCLPLISYDYPFLSSKIHYFNLSIIENKLHPKDPVPGLMRFALFLAILAATFYTTYFSNQPTIVC